MSELAQRDGSEWLRAPTGRGGRWCRPGLLLTAVEAAATALAATAAAVPAVVVPAVTTRRRGDPPSGRCSPRRRRPPWTPAAAPVARAYCTGGASSCLMEGGRVFFLQRCKEKSCCIKKQTSARTEKKRDQRYCKRLERGRHGLGRIGQQLRGACKSLSTLPRLHVGARRETKRHCKVPPPQPPPPPLQGQQLCILGHFGGTGDRGKTACAAAFVYVEDEVHSGRCRAPSSIADQQESCGGCGSNGSPSAASTTCVGGVECHCSSQRWDQCEPACGEDGGPAASRGERADETIGIQPAGMEDTSIEYWEAAVTVPLRCATVLQ